MESKREYLFDNLKGMLIILVVLGHFIERYISKDEKLRYIYEFIYIFHMPLFIFISGYFSKKTSEIRKKSISNLLIPYLILNVLYYTYIYIIEGNHKINLFNPGFTLWYLLSLFFWRFFLKDIIKINNKVLIIVLSISLGLAVGLIENNEYFLSFARTISFLPYFILGYFCFRENIKEIRGRSRTISIVLICLIGILIPVVIEKYNIPYKVLHLVCGYKKCSFGNIAYGILFRLCIYILSFIMSCSFINIMTSKKCILSRIGAKSMYIYAGHIYFIFAFKRFIPLYNTKINLILCCVFSLITIGILKSRFVENLYNSCKNIVLKIKN